MRALLVLRPDARRRLGGDVVLCGRTAAALRDLDVVADIVETDAPDARDYDVAHVFGIFEPEVCAAQMAACRRAGVGVAVSPIWTDRTEFLAKAPHAERLLATSRREQKMAAQLERLRAAQPQRLLGRRARSLLARAQSLQAEVIRGADVLLPNAVVMARECALRFAASHIPFVVVNVGIDHYMPEQWHPARSGIVCVARVESLKNQALLAFALRKEPVEITLVGELYDAPYAGLCRHWGRGKLRLTGRLPQDEVRRIVAGAAVHAMPSWGDLPGISSLEAAAAGARIVVGNRGAEMEYFREGAAYADPADPDSIRDAVMGELAKPPRVRGDDLDQQLSALTWRRAGEQTKRGYEIALERRRA